MKGFSLIILQIAFTIIGHCQQAVPIRAAAKKQPSTSENLECPKPNQYQNRIRYGKREFIDFDLTNEFKLIAGQDTLAFKFQKTDVQWIEKISGNGKDILSITFAIKKFEGDTCEVYNVAGDLSKPEYLIFFKSYDCEIKTVEFADYEEAKKQPYIRRFFQSLAKE